jgi:prepilin signal peptidase PulO-like enzyme (type II secretory pathway)
MDLFSALLLLVVGLAIGSFLSAITYRLPKNAQFIKGRSACPRCKKQIAWYDNIPVISFLILKGKCRHCKKAISVRYPIIELATGLIFVLTGFGQVSCLNKVSSASLCSWNDILGIYTLPLFFLLIISLIIIFIIDLENKFIPDNLVFTGFATFVILLAVLSPSFYKYLLSGFVASALLLLIHLFTKGKGMGLGDVKFALLAGTILGWPNTLYWMYISFISGALVGVILIVYKKAKFGKSIPFAPFLVSSMIFVLLYGGLIIEGIIGIK